MSCIVKNEQSNIFQSSFYSVTAEFPRGVIKVASAIAAIALTIFLIKVFIVIGTTSKLTHDFTLITLGLSIVMIELVRLSFIYSCLRDTAAGLCTGLYHQDLDQGFQAWRKEISQTIAALTSVGRWIF